MWIVRLALRRPYTFVVAALLIVVFGALTIKRMAKDIFPEINVPVVSVIWTYAGLPPEEMEGRVSTIAERAYTLTVNDIEHMESQSISGISVIKVFFHPGAKIEAAVAQLSASSGTILRVLPPGITPPLIVRYSASNVPILQASVSSEELSEQQLYDFGLNFIRTQLATVQGAQVPLPYGGKPRQIMVDLDPEEMFAKGVSAQDVVTAVNAQNLILPSGTAKIGEREYNIRLNASPSVARELNDLPIKRVKGSVIYVRDVAHVHDGNAVQQNVVRADGKRSSLLTIIKSGGASTLDIVERIRRALPRIKSTLPESLKIDLLFDQSTFVSASLEGVLKEAVIAAVLTAGMILVFLGSSRSTLIVAISIPLSILCSILALHALGQTLNIMTLGGLALAVGMLVDDATVEIENIHRNLAQKKPIEQAILDGAQQIATPAFVSTLSICIVFVPVFLLTGATQSLFVPLALAVIFAMLASYLLSRTLIPTLVQYLLANEAKLYQEQGEHARHPGLAGFVHEKFNAAFERFREGYKGLLEGALNRRKLVLAGFAAFVAGSLALLPSVGQDFFPSVDAGLIRMHVAAAPGTRIEETERLFTEVENTIREVIPAKDLHLVLDNFGVPAGGINLAWTDSTTVGPSDGEILVALSHEHEGSTPVYVTRLRKVFAERFPQLTIFFQPADMVSQILNFGLPAPIDIQVVGRNQTANYPIAKEVAARVAKVQGAVDVHLQQALDWPELRVKVDRTLAQEVGLSERDVANDLVVSLSSSGIVSPNYWLNPENGVNYLVATQTPQRKIDSIDALEREPLSVTGDGQVQLLGNVATVERGNGLSVVSHYNVQRVFDIYANVEGRDLASVAKEIDRSLAELEPRLPRGSYFTVRGQVESMRSSFASLAGGLAFAIVLVYFLLVVNFQSWTDSFVILLALPGALAGVAWALFVTQTTINVPSLMGAIMSLGVATANSILLVTFANDKRREGLDATAAALAAGFTRLRPVLMTAFAMIIGMLPMSLGLGEGGEQNAPLGRAVVGGLLVATFATLFFVPVAYSVLRRSAPSSQVE
jgi:CzcA family heavy metal efflux pump